MDICAELQVKDKPGVLLSVIEPVSMIGGNIVTIVHNRDNTFQDNLSLSLTIDVEQGKIQRILDIWKSRNIAVLKMSEHTDTFHMDYMLIGALTGSVLERLTDTVRRKAKVTRINIEMSEGDGGSGSAMFSVDAPSSEDLEAIDSELSSAARRSNFIYIRGLGR